ncbi:MBG domain-containing protein [Stenotrophomonas acidaminiphila]|uniref:MBG domain-containing protein n=1 Tax=Stenotrophomonas acidaminiphila TaxID=128780 RepID=UPI0015FA3EAB|nr:MBG domain-containing protein [Stenotrophomonas acidaminiphila]
MNRIYRLVFNHALGQVQVASELGASPGAKTGATRRLPAGVRLTPLALGLLLSVGSFGVMAQSLPGGGSIASGSGQIGAPGGNQLIINQASDKLAINWQSFNIGAGQKVTFNQPGANSIALNRVLGVDGSVIMGQLDANGRVFLVNPNGILFGASAQVNVGGLVASTLGISDADFVAGNYRFKGDGSNAAVINHGSLNTSAGGTIALLGGRVSNHGVIVANQGSVALAAGDAMTLDFAGNGLLNLRVDEGMVDALVENHQLIRADGGQVLLTAHAGDALLRTVVNNTGVIEARTLGEKDGRILLLGDFDGGVVNVAGTLDASAPDGGNGGFIETSGAHVRIADDVKVTTLAEPGRGRTGEWLIDPYNVTISNAGSTGMGGFNGSANDSVLNVHTLTNALASTGVTVTTGVGGSQAGNITVDAPINWSADTTLTLNAAGSVIINKDITATGTNAGLSLVYGNGYRLGSGARVTLSGSNASLSLGGTSYTLIHDLAGLQGVGASGNYALATDLDASATRTWNGGRGFAPLQGFSGTFTGLGHAVDGLTIARGTENNVGLFQAVSGQVRDLTLSNAAITGNITVGAITGSLSGSLSGIHVTGAVLGNGSNVGGLVGQLTNGTLQGASSSASVTGLSNVGGLAGTVQNGTLADAYSTGSVTGTISNSSAFAGGLVGNVFDSATLTNTYASGRVRGYTATGGLIGGTFLSTISFANSYWDVNSTGQVSSASGGIAITSANARSQATYGGFDFANTWVMFEGDTRPMLRSEYSTTVYTPHALQLIGMNLAGNYRLGTSLDLGAALATNGNGYYSDVWGASGFRPLGSDSAAFTGSFNGQGFGLIGLAINRASTNYVGLFGYTSGATLANLKLVGGSVTGSDGVGALVGYMTGGTLGSASASTTVSGTSTGEANTGGLVGANDGGAIADASASGNVTGAGYQVGGLVGSNFNGGSITRAHATGKVTGTNPNAGLGYVGGLVGANGYSGNGGSISQSYATGTVTAAAGPIGGLVGHNEGSITDSYATGAVIGQGSASNIGGFAGVNFVNGTISNSYSTGYVAGGSQRGGFVGYNNAGNSAISNVYWDIQTSGQALGAAGGLSTGITGRTTAQLQGSLPAGFASSIWGIGTNLYPYLQWRYSTTPHAVSGRVFSGAGSTALAGATVSAVSAGQLIGSASTGANGYYYVLGEASRFDGNGALTYLEGGSSQGAAFSDRVGYLGIQGLDIYASAMRLVTGQGSLTATRSRYLATRGSYTDNDLGFLAPYDFGALTDTGHGLYLSASSASYSLDTDLGSGGLLSLDGGGQFSLSGNRQLSAGGNLDVGDRLTWNDNAALTLSTSNGGNIVLGDGIGAANGSLTLSAAGSVTSNGAVNLGVLDLANGSWTQVAASLPGFNVTDFRLGPGAAFVRALGGDGSAATPYRIADVYGLQGLASSSLAGSRFVLAGDIDASGSALWNSGAGFLSIGSLATPFTGRLDGQGHRISGLAINRAGSTYSGLFGYNAGYVGNLNLVGGSVAGGTYAGALVGYNAASGVVERVSSDTNVTGTGNVGALVGSNAGTLSESLATGSASGGLNGGGLAGSNTSTGTIRDSYATGSAQGGAAVGGLVGFNEGSLQRVYATGNATSSVGATGGLVGSNAGTATGSFWNTTSSGLAQGVGAGNASGVSGQTSAQLSRLAPFIAAGWNIDAAGGTGTTWRMYEGHSAPLLRSFMTPLSVDVGNASKTYDGSATSSAGALLFPSGYDPSLVSGSAVYTANSANAGTYSGASLSVGGLYSSQFGYDIKTLAGTLTIGKAGLTITANNGSKTYGQTGGVNGFTASGLVNGDTVSSVALASAGTAATANVGNYTITAANAGGTGLSNYDITYVNGTLTIGKAGLTITANNGSKTYGQTGGTNGFTASGLVDGDTVSSVALASAGTAATANVGDYTITAANADGTGLSNYDITYVNGTLTIGKAGLTITANNNSKTYGQTGGANGFTASGLVNGDTVTTVDLASAGTGATANVGDYTITAANADGTGLSNYDITYVDGTLTIGKAGLTITANNGNKTYGQTGGTNGFSASGLVNGDTVTAVALASAGTAATANVGDYTITAANADGTGLSNYDITYVNGILTIGKAGLTITANNASKTIGQLSALNGYTAEGLVNGDTIDAVRLFSDGSGVNAQPGSYAILASDAQGARLGNYDITYREGTLEVTGISVAQTVQVGREVAANLRTPTSGSPIRSSDPALYRLTGSAIAPASDACTSLEEVRCPIRQPE